eukprot:TRINITY_DN16977_c0_g1_i1.p1 TRINITY_DN16977_c0_g1~~TRINITY_DN16977_c0_g1_i1.p1  ORF type:complete len:710 (+),score=117.12 TRINITY_DN16977_c0_g1_i1:239-2131(+)
MQTPAQLDRHQSSISCASSSDDIDFAAIPEQENPLGTLHAEKQPQKHSQLPAPCQKSWAQASADQLSLSSQLLTQQQSQSSSSQLCQSSNTEDANCRNISLGEADARARPVSNSACFDEVADVEGALHVAWKFLGQMSIADLVGTAHLVAKLAAAGSWGKLKGQAALRSDVRFLGVLSRLEVHSSKLESPRNITRVVWAMGKVRLKNDAVEAIMANIVEIVPSRLHLFSPHELSTVLWGLASSSEMGSLCCSKQLALLVIAECTHRLSTFSQQSCINSFWAVAKMELSGGVVDTFASSCLEQIHKSMSDSISPQGLASSIWACGHLVVELNAEINRQMATQFCMDAARRAMSSEDFLKGLSPHELSMMMWGMAKLAGRKEQVLEEESDELLNFAMAAAKVGLPQIKKFRPKALANVAWSLATLHLVEHEITINFLVAASIVAEPAVATFCPQTLVNLLWALGQAKGLRKVGAIVRLGKAAAHQALRRIDDFAWPDLATVMNVFAHLGLAKEAEIQTFAIALVEKTTLCCSRIHSSVLLSITKSAALMQVESEKLKLLVLSISNVLSWRSGRLNDMDIGNRSGSHVFPRSQGFRFTFVTSHQNQSAVTTQSSTQSGGMNSCCYLGRSFKLL